MGSKDWRRWAAAYISAVMGFVDSESKRANTADCLDRQRQVKR